MAAARNASLTTLAPFTALLPTDSDVEYWALERAAKALRRDPARYQSVEGVEYRRGGPHLFRWEIEFDEGRHVDGLVGCFPLEALMPHESTTPKAAHRPQHPVQIRPVMALTEQDLPQLDAAGPTVHFHGDHHHAVTPLTPTEVTIGPAVIADGHHRVAAAIRTGAHSDIMALVVSSTDTDLTAGAFHRVFPGASPLPERLPGCRVVREPPRTAIRNGRIAVVTPESSIGVAVTSPDAARWVGLPAGLAEQFVVPELEIDRAEVAYVDDIRNALGAVDRGHTAIVLPEAEVAAVLRAAAEPVSLPPKSTRFRPKPIRGLLMRPLPGY